MSFVEGRVVVYRPVAHDAVSFQPISVPMSITSVWVRQNISTWSGWATTFHTYTSNKSWNFVYLASNPNARALDVFN